MINVLLFGPIADRMQAREMSVEFTDGMKLLDVIAQLSAQHSQAFDIVSFIAVNQIQVRDKQLLLCDNDEVAFMAKFSGG